MTLESAGTTHRVGLNARLLSLKRSYRAAGVSRYIHGLLTYLPQVDPGFGYHVFGGHGGVRFPGWSQHASRWPTGRPVGRILWEQIAQPWEARRRKLDLLHVPVNVGPVIGPCPVVVTVHDLSFYLYPELFRPLRGVYQRALTHHTATHAAGVIAVSRSTRTDLIRLLGLPEGRVTVIPNGVGDEMHPIEGRDQVRALRRERGLPEHMILFLGTIEPRKNLSVLLEAYALFRREQDLRHQLVIAGGKGWYYEDIHATVERLGLRNQVIFPGYVQQNELALWYNAADLFVYPSLYEGFGLPPLEAMACGAPVIVSNASSLPEVVGDAGVTVDPHDPHALATAMSRVLGDASLRHRLREAGLSRAKRFSWRTTALETSKLYRRILRNRDTHVC